MNECCVQCLLFCECIRRFCCTCSLSAESLSCKYVSKMNECCVQCLLFCECSMCVCLLCCGYSKHCASAKCLFYRAFDSLFVCLLETLPKTADFGIHQQMDREDPELKIFKSAIALSQCLLFTSANGHTPCRRRTQF